MVPLRRLCGFTLIELLVVFAIMALVMAVVPIAYDKMHSAAQYREVVRGMVTGLRAARQRAELSGRDVVFSVDLRQRSYGLEGTREQSIPETVFVRATVASSHWMVKSKSLRKRRVIKKTT